MTKPRGKGLGISIHGRGISGKPRDYFGEIALGHRKRDQRSTGESWWIDAPRDGLTALAEQKFAVQTSGERVG
jgi:hypothetical protein